MEASGRLPESGQGHLTALGRLGVLDGEEEELHEVGDLYRLPRARAVLYAM